MLFVVLPGRYLSDHVSYEKRPIFQVADLLHTVFFAFRQIIHWDFFHEFLIYIVMQRITGILE